MEFFKYIEDQHPRTSNLAQELPVMAPHIPESYDIFNYAALLVSISNVIPVMTDCASG